MKKPILTGFQMIKPLYEKTQAALNEWVNQCHIQAEEVKSATDTVIDVFTGVLDGPRLKSLFLRYAVKPSQIAKRSFECPDLLDRSIWSQKQIYRITAETPSGADILQRHQFFSARALEIMRQFYKKTQEKNQAPPQHLIHVTCTGYVSPSAAQLLISEKKWQTDITHAYHMGCYAALPAIRMAQALGRAVDVVHTEMCSLHMNPLNHTPEQIIVQSLFADGHIKYSVAAQDSPRKGDLHILCIKELIIPDSEHDMSWIPSSWGMQMTLSRAVPDKIQQHLKLFLMSLCKEDFTNILKTALFAIHPGGPKIIEAVQKTLELRDDQCQHSKEILFTRGNMSSATLPHIWKAIVESKPASGTKIVSLAFGPGLTLFGAVFEVT